MKLLGVFRVCSQAVFMTCSVSTTQHKVSRSAQTSTTSSPSKSEIRDEQQRSKRNNSHGAVYLDAADMFLCAIRLWGQSPKRLGDVLEKVSTGIYFWGSRLFWLWGQSQKVSTGAFCRLLFSSSSGPLSPLFGVCGTPPCRQIQGRRTQVPRPCLSPQAVGPAPCRP